MFCSWTCCGLSFQNVLHPSKLGDLEFGRMMHNLVLLQGLNEFLTGSKQIVAGPCVLLVVELHVFPVHLDDAVREYMTMMVMTAGLERGTSFN